MKRTLSYRHRVVTDDDVGFIRRLIVEHPGSSRRDLSKKLCEAWNWVQANGALRDRMCRGLMLMLHREGLIELPPVRQVSRNTLVDRYQPVTVSVDSTPLQMRFAELGVIELRQVRRTPEEALFNGLLQQHHYLAYTQPAGEHLKYGDHGAWQGRPHQAGQPVDQERAGLSLGQGLSPAAGAGRRVKRVDHDRYLAAAAKHESGDGCHGARRQPLPLSTSEFADTFR